MYAESKRSWNRPMSLYVNLPFLYTDNKVAVSSNAELPHSYWLSNLDSRSCRKWESVKFWGAGAHSQGNSYAYAMAFLKTGLSVSKPHFRVPGSSTGEKWNQCPTPNVCAVDKKVNDILSKPQSVLVFLAVSACMFC